MMLTEKQEQGLRELIATAREKAPELLQRHPDALVYVGIMGALAQELGPYRKAAKREIDGPWIDPALPPYIDTNEPNAWAEAQRDLTPADMRAVEARRQNVIVGPPYTPTKIRE